MGSRAWTLHGIGSDAPALLDDLVNASRWNIQCNGQGVDAEPEWGEEVLAQNLAGVDWPHTIDRMVQFELLQW